MLANHKYKEFLNLNKTTQKLVKYLNRHFCKENVQMANKHMKKFLSLIIRNLQTKTTMRYHFISNRMTRIKTNKCW